MIKLIIGIVLGIAIILLARKTGFENDTSFYPLVLIVIAFYYVLFAFMASSINEILYEVIIAFLFSILAVWGHHKSLKIVAIGLILHGLYDVFQHNIAFSTKPPDWWPMFCLGIDFIMGFWLLWFLNKKNIKSLWNNIQTY